MALECQLWLRPSVFLSLVVGRRLADRSLTPCVPPGVEVTLELSVDDSDLRFFGNGAVALFSYYIYFTQYWYEWIRNVTMVFDPNACISHPTLSVLDNNS